MIELYPHQSELLCRIETAFQEGARCVVAQAPTGFGKTACASVLLQDRANKGERALFLAHLDTLVEDTHAALTSLGVWTGFFQAGRPTHPLAPVQVCSLQTLHARSERPPADFIVLDEAHRACAMSVRGILSDYPKAKILGLTATPQRADGQPLGDIFECLIEGPSVRWLTDRGYLVPCDVIAPRHHCEEGLAFDPLNAYQTYAPGQRALVFASNLAHVKELVTKFGAAGIAAEGLTSTTPKAIRADLRERVTRGELQALIGVGVFIEGFDLPSAECIVLARGFTVPGSYLQSIGRGFRPSPGKERCTVLDLRGSVHLHGLPDEERRWSLEGLGVYRTEKFSSLRRCSECLALFRPASTCSRCGASAVGTPVLPRVMHRSERLARINALPAHERDRLHLAQLASVARGRMGMGHGPARRWAYRKFWERFGREPVTHTAAGAA